MQKIYYDIKYTSASTDYLTLSDTDMATVQLSTMGILTYMTELSIAKDKDIRDFTTVWFTKPDRRYHYNKKLQRYNSPQSYLAGTLNNLQFGKQRDLSLTQLQTLQDIINLSVDVIEAVEAFSGNTLQENKMFTKIWIQQNLWSVT
jgi:hypothetical protein